MENIKVKVENNIDELVSLFGDLGCKYFNHTVTDKKYMIYQDGKCFFVKSKKEFNMSDCKEITLQQLKDMVVLKRNDRKDATHVNLVTGSKVLQQGDKNYYWQLGEWHLYPCGVDIKPIGEKEMKEFLVNHDNKWTLQLLDSDTEENSYRVAVPNGAEIYVYFCGDGRAYFYNPSNEIFENHWMDASRKAWSFNEIKKGFAGEILWQQSETKSLNDQYAEIEQVRQETVKVTIDELKHRVYKKDVSHLDSIDVYRVLELFNVQSHAVGHAIKKLLCSGGRGAKDEAQDIQEAIDSLIRYQEMKNEDQDQGQDCVSIDW